MQAFVVPSHLAFSDRHETSAQAFVVPRTVGSKDFQVLNGPELCTSERHSRGLKVMYRAEGSRRRAEKNTAKRQILPRFAKWVGHKSDQ